MKETIKHACGSIAAHLFAGSKRACEGDNDMPSGRFGNMISAALIRNAASKGDHAALRSHLTRYWQGDQGDAFYRNYADRFDRWFLGEHYPLIEELKELVSSSPDKFHQVFEMGCGDGQVLNHLSETLSGITDFVGLDINQGIIQRNRSFYDSPRLRFESGDAGEWITNHAQSGTILMSYGGVMEYFTEEELLTMFQNLRDHSPVAIALVEPLYDNYDLATETDSRPCGAENSFTHNHRHLLEKAGYTLRFEREPEMEFRWMMILAEG